MRWCRNPALAPTFQILVENLLSAEPVSAVRISRSCGLALRRVRPSNLQLPTSPPTQCASGGTTSARRSASRSWPAGRSSISSSCACSSGARSETVFRSCPNGRSTSTCADAAADRLVRAFDADPLLRAVEALALGAGQEPVARDAQHLAALLAHSARFIRGIVKDRLAELRAEGTTANPLLDVHGEFRNVLYAHPEAGGYATSGFDELFSAAFAQTVAFGLLLVREGSGGPVGDDAWTRMPAEHPLMRTVLRVLTQSEIIQEVGIGFSVMLATANSFAPEIFGRTTRPTRPDPIRSSIFLRGLSERLRPRRARAARRLLHAGRGGALHDRRPGSGRARPSRSFGPAGPKPHHCRSRHRDRHLSVGRVPRRYAGRARCCGAFGKARIRVARDHRRAGGGRPSKGPPADPRHHRQSTLPPLGGRREPHPGRRLDGWCLGRPEAAGAQRRTRRAARYLSRTFGRFFGAGRSGSCSRRRARRGGASWR